MMMALTIIICSFGISETFLLSLTYRETIKRNWMLPRKPLEWHIVLSVNYLLIVKHMLPEDSIIESILIGCMNTKTASQGEDTGCTRALESVCESFCIGTYLPIIDSLIAEVRRRKSVYCILQQNINFLLNLNTWAISDIKNTASKLLKVYASDSDCNFPSEVVLFAFYIRSSPDLGSKTNTAQAQLSHLKKNCLIETFPNVVIILRMYLTLPVANTEGELSFSVLKRVKNCLRSSLTHDHVCDFCIYDHRKEFHKIYEL